MGLSTMDVPVGVLGRKGDTLTEKYINPGLASVQPERHKIIATTQLVCDPSDVLSAFHAG